MMADFSASGVVLNRFFHVDKHEQGCRRRRRLICRRPRRTVGMPPPIDARTGIVELQGVIGQSGDPGNGRFARRSRMIAPKKPEPQQRWTQTRRRTA